MDDKKTAPAMPPQASPNTPQKESSKAGARIALDFWRQFDKRENEAIDKWFIIGFITATVQVLKQREGVIIAHYALQAVRNSVEN